MKGSALEVERVQVVGLRKLPSMGLKILGGFAEGLSFITAEKAKAGWKRDECDRCSEDSMS